MTLGILGGGQLGRMLALAAANLGVRVRAYDEAADACAGQVCDLHVGTYDDDARLDAFAAGCDAITYEFENVPVSAAQRLAARAAVCPPPAALAASQDRLTEKTLFVELGIDTPAFAPIDAPGDLAAALDRVGLPAVLKTRRGGYDGKGQAVVRTLADAAHASEMLDCGRIPLIAEAFVPFTSEVSALLVRGRAGEEAMYPLCQNRHAGGILRETLVLPDAPRALVDQATGAATAIAQRLDYVGVLAVEFFELNGRLLANEMAPRVHNSGHWTMDGAATSQFENHVRAVLGLPLGPTAATTHAAMLNLIGQHPPLESLLALPGAKVHLYGKEPRPGRKLGHVNLLASDPASLSRHLARARQLIEPAAQ
ncbi:MAG: 5-(carboxyamino)imidazole ribonucleotide synthase [Phycisphaerales bacterium]